MLIFEGGWQTMTSNKLEDIRARCDAARPGPWTAIIEGRDQDGGSSFIMIGKGDARAEDLHLSGYDEAVPTADYDFIANARDDIPWLLAEIERLKRG
jgi:hypothetical protein